MRRHQPAWFVWHTQLQHPTWCMRIRMPLHADHQMTSRLPQCECLSILLYDTPTRIYNEYSTKYGTR